jgi:DNA replication protein DnaC
MPYRKRLKRAYKNGYGLLFLGDNGTGKTLFISYLLGRAVHSGFSIYYTTLKRLDLNIKRGFDDHAAGRRLREMLAADFLAIDELGKEHAKSAYLQSELEDLLKSRYDDGYPTLLASNLGHSDLSQMYGSTIASMIDGRYEKVMLETGDYRQKVSASMRTNMGYR